MLKPKSVGCDKCSPCNGLGEELDYIKQELEDKVDTVYVGEIMKTPSAGEIHITKSDIEALGIQTEIDVDDALSEQSENPVQNKVITAKVNELADDIDAVESRVDSIEDDVSSINTEVESLDDRVESVEDDISTLETSLQGKVTDVVLGFNGNNNIDLAKYRNGVLYDDDIIPIDQTPSNTVQALVSSKAVYDALLGKEDTLVFDATPQSGSSNPVTSDGIYQAIANVGGGGMEDVTSDLTFNAINIRGKAGYQALLTGLDDYDDYTYIVTVMSDRSSPLMAFITSTNYLQVIADNTNYGYVSYIVVYRIKGPYTANALYNYYSIENNLYGTTFTYHTVPVSMFNYDSTTERYRAIVRFTSAETKGMRFFFSSWREAQLFFDGGNCYIYLQDQPTVAVTFYTVCLATYNDAVDGYDMIPFGPIVSSGSSVTVDTSLDSTSTNPVTNAAISTAITALGTSIANSVVPMFEFVQDDEWSYDGDTYSNTDVCTFVYNSGTIRPAILHYQGMSYIADTATATTLYAHANTHQYAYRMELSGTNTPTLYTRTVPNVVSVVASGNNNAVTSGAVYTAIQNASGSSYGMIFDSPNPVGTSYSGTVTLQHVYRLIAGTQSSTPTFSLSGTTLEITLSDPGQYMVLEDLGYSANVNSGEIAVIFGDDIIQVY